MSRKIHSWGLVGRHGLEVMPVTWSEGPCARLGGLAVHAWLDGFYSVRNDLGREVICMVYLVNLDKRAGYVLDWSGLSDSLSLVGWSWPKIMVGTLIIYISLF